MSHNSLQSLVRSFAGGAIIILLLAGAMRPVDAERDEPAATSSGATAVRVAQEPRIITDQTGMITKALVPNQPFVGPGNNTTLWSPRTHSATQQSSAGGWSLECVDCPRSLYGDLGGDALQVDAQGRLHVVYGPVALSHAVKEQGAWHIETADGSYGVGMNAVMAFDGGGRPHAIYLDLADRKLKYAWYDGVRWSSETIEDPGVQINLQTRPSLALDDNGWPHVTVFDDPSKKVHYGRRLGSGWQWQVAAVAPMGGSDEGVPLVLDQNGLPHIGYFDYVDGSYRPAHTWFDGNAWRKVTAESFDGIRGDASLALDQAGRAHLAYSYERIVDGVASGRVLAYVRFDQAQPVTEQVMESSTESIAWTVKLRLDQAGNPHIGHIGTCSPYSVMYSYKQDGGWATEKVAEGRSRGSFALDLGESPHFVFVNGINALEHVWKDDEGWQTEFIEQGQRAGEWASGVLDHLGLAHVVYGGGSYGALQLTYARHDGLHWNLQPVDKGYYDYFKPSIVLDQRKQPHVLYRKAGWDSAVLTHAWLGNDGWHTNELDSDSQLGVVSSLALDGSGRPHASYYKGTQRALTYGWLDGDQWRAETVTTGNFGVYISLSLDSSGQPHIGYYDGDNSVFMHAWKDVAGWQTATITTKAGWGAVEFDRSGRPHVAYGDPADFALHYRWHDDSGWQSEVVTTPVNGCCSGCVQVDIALDSSDRPRLVYTGNEGIEYAAKDGSSWHTELVTGLMPGCSMVGTGSWVQPLSIALDSSGTGHIFFPLEAGMSGPAGLIEARPTGNNISGRISDSQGRGLSDVIVSTGVGLGAVSDSEGFFRMPALSSGSYTLTPTKTGYGFSPPSRTVTVPPDVTSQDFIAEALTYSVSGRVLDASGQPVFAATISDGAGHSTKTDSSGNYKLGGFTSGTYVLTPAKNGYTFSPPSRTATLPPDAQGQGFTATPAGMIRAWTIMHYMAADNDADMQQSLAWEYGRLHLAAGNSAINMAVMWDSLSTSTRYVAFPEDQDAIIVDKGELNTGDPATLRDFVTWAKSNYPARHYALVISDHGSGLGGVALDRHTPSYAESGDLLTPAELKQALVEAGPVDVLYMNACSMGMVESAYQVRDVTAYYVASEALIWGPMVHDTYAVGWQPGSQAIPAITSQTGAEELAINMARAATWMMRDNPVTSRPGTMSACTMSKLGDVVAKASELAQRINSDMSAQAPLLQTMASPTVLQHFEMDSDYQITEADDYVDLYHFAQVMQALSSNAAIRATAGELMSAIDEYCVYAEGWSGQVVDESDQVHSWTHANSHGVSIFFTQPAWYNVFYNVDWLDFAAGTNWHISALAASNVAGDTIEWGPMLVQFVRTVNPGALDKATPPSLLRPLTTLTRTYLPLLLR